MSGMARMTGISNDPEGVESELIFYDKDGRVWPEKSTKAMTKTKAKTKKGSK